MNIWVGVQCFLALAGLGSARKECVKFSHGGKWCRFLGDVAEVTLIGTTVSDLTGVFPRLILK